MKEMYMYAFSLVAWYQKQSHSNNLHYYKNRSSYSCHPLLPYTLKSSKCQRTSHHHQGARVKPRYFPIIIPNSSLGHQVRDNEGLGAPYLIHLKLVLQTDFSKTKEHCEKKVIAQPRKFGDFNLNYLMQKLNCLKSSPKFVSLSVVTFINLKAKISSISPAQIKLKGKTQAMMIFQY